MEGEEIKTKFLKKHKYNQRDSPFHKITFVFDCLELIQSPMK